MLGIWNLMTDKVLVVLCKEDKARTEAGSSRYIVSVLAAFWKSKRKNEHSKWQAALNLKPVKPDLHACISVATIAVTKASKVLGCWVFGYSPSRLTKAFGSILGPRMQTVSAPRKPPFDCFGLDSRPLWGSAPSAGLSHGNTSQDLISWEDGTPHFCIWTLKSFIFFSDSLKVTCKMNLPIIRLISIYFFQNHWLAISVGFRGGCASASGLTVAGHGDQPDIEDSGMASFTLNMCTFISTLYNLLYSVYTLHICIIINSVDFLSVQVHSVIDRHQQTCTRWSRRSPNWSWPMPRQKQQYE